MHNFVNRFFIHKFVGRKHFLIFEFAPFEDWDYVYICTIFNLETMATIKFSLSNKERSDTNEHEILLRLSIDRQHVFRAKTGLYVNKKSWDEKNQKIIVSRMRTMENAAKNKLQGDIDALKNTIISEALSTPISTINKDWLVGIIQKLTGRVVMSSTCSTMPNSGKNNFVDSLEYFIKVQCKSKRRADHFHCMMRMVKRFCVYACISLDINTLSSDHLLQFENFLQIEHTFFDSNGKCIKHAKVYEKEPCITTPQRRGINAVNEIMRRLRTFFNWAVKNKLTENNPFLVYKVPTCVYGTPYFLTSEERDELFAFDFSSRPALSIQRDIFVFQSNVGMRVGDLYELTTANIVNDALEYVANKTKDESGQTIRVPLSLQAKEILSRYQSCDQVELLPFISIQKYNKAIKEMLRLAGIDRVVTVLNPTTRVEEQHPIWEVASSHMARRNFIGNLYNKTQDPNAIGSMTGHVEGSRAFARYRSIDDKVKKSLIDML